VCLCSSAFCEFSCQPNFRSNRQRREQDATYNSGHAGTSSAFLPVLFLKFPQRDSPSSAKSAPVSPTLTRHTCVTVLLSRVFHSLLPVKIKARYVVGGISPTICPGDRYLFSKFRLRCSPPSVSFPLLTYSTLIVTGPQGALAFRPPIRLTTNQHLVENSGKCTPSTLC